jgi:general secretion pathway protein B
MSYILDALRKSESERRSRDAIATPDLMSQPPVKSGNRLGWMVALILLMLNLSGVGYLWIRDRQQPSILSQTLKPVDSVNQMAPVNSISNGGVLPPTPVSIIPSAGTRSDQADVAVTKDRVLEVQSQKTLVDKRQGAETGIQSGNTVTKLPDAAANVSMLPLRKQKNASQPTPDLNSENYRSDSGRPETPGVERIDDSVKKSQNVKPNESMVVKDTTVHSDRITLKSPASRPGNPVSDQEADDDLDEEDNMSVDSFGSDHKTSNPGKLPMFADLAPDFQEKLPEFRINVFAYSKLPAERFAIIDMKKYRVGERIPGGALLQEIQPEWLVMELDGQKFRYPRP